MNEIGSAQCVVGRSCEEVALVGDQWTVDVPNQELGSLPSPELGEMFVSKHPFQHVRREIDADLKSV